MGYKTLISPALQANIHAASGMALFMQLSLYTK
jgi:hypothetical protein